MTVDEAERLLYRDGFTTERGFSMLYAMHVEDPVASRRHRIPRRGYQTVSGAAVWELIELRRAGWSR